MAEMQFDIIIILAKHKYPPVGENYDEVYKKVLEQAENFKKGVMSAQPKKFNLPIYEESARMVADDSRV